MSQLPQRPQTFFAPRMGWMSENIFTDRALMCGYGASLQRPSGTASGDIVRFFKKFNELLIRGLKLIIARPRNNNAWTQITINNNN